MAENQVDYLKGYELCNAGVCARLGAAAPAHERHVVLLRAQRSVAIRKARRRGVAVAAG